MVEANGTVCPDDVISSLVVRTLPGQLASGLVGIALLGAVSSVSAVGTFPAEFDVAELDGSNGLTLSGAGNVGGETLHFGRTVSGDGDFNDDGIADLVTGDSGAARPPGGFARGQAYVIFGTANGFPANLAVSTLNGQNGFSVTGGIQLAESVSNAGDINHDGIDDIVVSERVASAGAAQNGRVYIIFGKNTQSSGNFPANIDVPAAINGSNGFEIRGASGGDLAGSSVSAAGDVNGDGVDDVIIGATQSSFLFPNGTGAAYVVFGRDTSVTGSFPAVFSLAGLDGVNGFKLSGIDIEDRTGSLVSGAGDVNHDGVSDVIIGTGFVPRTFVVFGRDVASDGDFPANLELAGLNGSNGFLITGDRAGAIGAAGDINHDGIDDLALGQSARSSLESGRAYVIYGVDAATGPGFPASFDVNDLNGSNGFRMIGIRPPDGIDGTGRSVGGVGDINDDGIDDLGIKNEPFGLKETYVLFGRDTAISGPFSNPFFLADLDGTNGFVVKGTGDNTSGPPDGPKVAKAGDVNDDGVNDMIIGTGQEAAYVVFGRGDGAGTVPVDIDVKPDSCRNPVKVTSRGLLPVAIVGGPDFDVTTVDVTSIRLEGVAPLRWSYDDVSRPHATGCEDTGGDGYLDLALKFKTRDIAATLGDVDNRDVVDVTLTGNLSDGTPIEGEDAILILK